MKLQKIQGFDVAGYSVRTTNLAEQEEGTAKIGHLWQRFFSEVAPSLDPGAKVYGLYTNYESDYTGEFDVIACSDCLISSDADFVSTQIATGNYLVFSAKGEFPTVVIELWKEVWAYFSDPNYPHQRSYNTDFEFYKSADEVEIYIGVEL
ncbi:GyrI-like domain-containing protein [Vibrio sp. M260118]|uniref:GyrI-like domain-containing protein n=1 Tax=Vibrio sp. M260118 TaxID=3020896 RepID=UPI002F40B267